MRKRALGFLIAVAVLILLFLAGPRIKIDLQFRPISLPKDLDHYLAQSEARFPDLVPGAEKTIVWANAQEIERRYALFGTKLKALRPITQSVNRDNHVLAGDILAASNTRNVEEIILNFISKLP